MPEDNNDLLLSFRRDKDGSYVTAECGAIVNPGDALIRPDDYKNDFRPGNFFEAQDFSFGAGLVDPHDTDGVAANSKQHKDLVAALLKAGTKLPPGLAKSADAGFKDWRYKLVSPTHASGYPVDLQEVSFSRLMDEASVQLFRACSYSEMFRTVTAIKRTITGEGQGMRSFMRMRFTDVLITDLKWDDDEVVKESIQFICRGVEVVYLPQDSSGVMRSDKPTFGRWAPFATTR